MGESTLKTLDDIMFVQGETPMTQENWQKYFGGVLPNGIYEGFAPRTDYRGETVNGITAGVAVYNGLVYRMADRFAVDREVLESEGYRLLSLRIYPDTGVAKLVETRGNAPVSSDETILNGIIQMTQNPVVSGRDSDQNSYVDYRLCYQGHKNSLYRAGVDLRQPALMRNGKFPTGWSTYWNGYEPSATKIILSGNMVFNYIAPRTDWAMEVWFDPMNPPDNAKVVTNAHYVTFHEYPAIVDVTRSGDHPDFIYGMKDEFRNVIDCFGTNWERQTQPGAGHIYNDPVVWEYHDATPETPFVVQYRGKNGSQNMFLIQMPTDGASTEWGLVEGTLSNQQDLKEALDAKADATAVYSKTETYTKAETDALLSPKANSADVYAKTETYTKTETDVLLDAKANASDVYTKSDTDEIVSTFYSKTETDALLDEKADASDVYNKADVYSKSEMDTALGAKANSSSVYTKSQTDTLLSAKEDKSALGTLAYQNSLSYSSLADKPTLGALASIDNVVLSANYVTGVLPVSKGGTGNVDLNTFLSSYMRKYIYVSVRNGDDTNDGSQAHPVRSIKRAIRLIGARMEGTIELADTNVTYFEDNLEFSSASRYVLKCNTGTRITPETYILLIHSSLHIIGDVRISGDISVQDGARITGGYVGMWGTLTIDRAIQVYSSSCFLNTVNCAFSGTPFIVDGGILICRELTGNFTRVGTATHGGIISVGDNHIFS